MTFYKAALTLILVMDPLGNIPVVISLLKGLSPQRFTRIIFRETVIASLILVLFLFIGSAVLDEFNISQPALQIGGGIILFLIAIKMIFPDRDNRVVVDDIEGEPFIVPLAIPLIAGPSALATVILFATNQPELMMTWLGAVFLASFVCLVTLLSARFLMRLFGPRGVIAMERLMGMILTTVSVQMFLDGAKLFFASN
jgi:multiple antibiotic resistance protein